jgi:Beta-propeller repeat
VGTDPAGNIYVTGYTLSSDFPVTGNAPQPQWGNGIDIFLAEITPHIPGLGALQYSTYIGGATINTGLGLAIGPDGTAYAVGRTEGLFPTSANAAQGGYGGGAYDGFVMIVTNSSASTAERKPATRPHPPRHGGIR